MPDLTELLRAAAPAPSEGFDEAALRRRVAQRRRRRRLGAAVTAVMAVALTLGISAVVFDRAGDRPIQVATRPGQPETAVWSVPGASGAAVASGAVWVGGEDISAHGVPTWFLARLDPATGAERARIPVPGPVFRVEAGLGMVWAFGGGDGAEPNGGVAVVDPATDQVTASYGYDHPFTPYDLAFTGQSAAVSNARGDEVLLLELRSSRLVIADRQRTGRRPTDLVAAGDGSLWVLESGDGTISRLPLGGQSRLRYPWAGHLLGPAAGGAIWATDGNPGRLVELSPASLADGASVALGTRVEVAASAIAVDPEGLWVGGPRGVFRFARPVLESSADPKPQASLPDYNVSSLAGDARAAFFVAGGQVYRWSAPSPSSPAASGPTFVGAESGRLARYDAATGRRLRFLTERQPGGGDGQPAVAADGTIYFVRGSGTCSSGIWRLPPVGGPEVPVVQLRNGTQSGVAVSPDGIMLAWIEQPCSDVAVLRTKNLQTGAVRSFTMDAPPSVEGRPDWSPDDRHLAYFYGRSGGGIGGVRVLDTASNARRADEGRPLGGPIGPTCAQNHPAYRPDGALVVLTCRDADHPDVVARRFDPVSGEPLDVVFTLEGTDPLGANVFGVDSFDLTGDGDHALYEVLADGQFHAWRWDRGNRPVRLTTEGRTPAW